MKANEQQLNVVSHRAEQLRLEAEKLRADADRKSKRTLDEASPPGRRDRRRGQGAGRADPHRVRARALGGHPATRQHQRPAHQRPADAGHPDRGGAARPDRRRAGRTRPPRPTQAKGDQPTGDKPKARQAGRRRPAGDRCRGPAVARQDAGRGRRRGQRRHQGARGAGRRRTPEHRQPDTTPAAPSPRRSPQPPSADGGRHREESAAADARSPPRAEAARTSEVAGTRPRSRDEATSAPARARPRRASRGALGQPGPGVRLGSGRPIRRDSPFMLGFLGALGVFVAWFLVQAVVQARSVIVLIVVALFLAIGLSPVVEWLIARGHAPRLRHRASCSSASSRAFVGFGFAVLPPVIEQSNALRQGAARTTWPTCAGTRRSASSTTTTA